jgi:hypothetical protein
MSVQTWTDDDGVKWVSCDALCVGDYGGSGTVGEANIRALQRDQPSEDWLTERGCYGHKQLWLIDNPTNRDIVEGLVRDYPLIDEEEYSRVETEWEDEAWRDYGYKDMMRLLKDRCRDDAADAMDFLSLDELTEVYYAIRQDGHEPVFEYSGCCLRLDRMADEYADRVRALALERGWVPEPVTD